MITQFCLKLLFGISLMWCFMSRREVTSGFFRIQMLLTLGISTLAAFTCYQIAEISPNARTGITIGCGVTAFVAYIGSVLWTLERRQAGTYCLCFLAISLGVLLIVASGSWGTITQLNGLLHVFSEVAGAGTLGGAMTGMLLGHWYLTTPTMSVIPLHRLNNLFGIACIFRLLISIAALALGWAALQSGVQFSWLALRWIAGIIGPLAAVWMTKRILAYKNTQSATGVLFVAVILTMIGELSASLLYYELKLPF